MSNDTQDTIATTAVALARDTPLPSKECTALLMQVGMRKVEVDVRLEAIAPERNGRFAGKVRTQTLRTGTTTQIAALDEELARLDIQQAQLGAQHTALTQRRERARREEASANLPSLHAAFLDQIETADAARNALDAALTALDGGLDAIFIARGLAKDGGLPAAGAAPETADRVEALSGAIGMLGNHRAVYGRVMGRDLRERLGVEGGDIPERWVA